MGREQEGVYLSKRNMTLLIVVFLVINVFFLLMGIVIGKENSRLHQAMFGEDSSTLAGQESYQAGSGPPDENGSASSSTIESVASQFEESDDSRPPMEVAYPDAVEESSNSDPVATPTIRDEDPVVEPSVSESTPPSEDDQLVDNPPTEQTWTPQPQDVLPPSLRLDAGYYVQVLAIREKSRAEGFKAKVDGAGFPSVLEFENGFYKVRVGYYATREEAIQVKNDLESSLKISKSWIALKK